MKANILNKRVFICLTSLLPCIQFTFLDIIYFVMLRKFLRCFLSRMGKLDKEDLLPGFVFGGYREGQQGRVIKAGSYLKTFSQLCTVSAYFLSSAKVYINAKYKQCMGIAATTNVITERFSLKQVLLTLSVSNSFTVTAFVCFNDITTG